MDRRAASEGKVWLVGAGPGDAELLTVKARSLLDSAEVIVYDALVSTEILSLIPESCRLINVGKRAGSHHVPQAEINRILLEEVQADHRVLRLKGGDPFVFGRGGEELELLAEAGISFEVVPGITSATAVPAYAGIPVTHRNFTSSFHVISGHPQLGGQSRVNYQALVDLDATLVFLMGAAAVGEICRGLLAAGMAAALPAAILERGTTSLQRTVISTVGQLTEETKASGIGTPAVIVVGDVCGLAGMFQWAEKRVLSGRQFLITRPRASSSGLAGRLRGLGAQVIELPAIAIRPIEANQEFERTLRTFSAIDGEVWLVFTSVVGVQLFFSQLRRLRLDLRLFFRAGTDVKIAAVGSVTARELEGHGLIADLVPKTYCAAALGQALAEKAGADSRILVFRAKEGAAELLEPFIEKGLEVVDIPLYESVFQMHEQIRDRIKDAIRHHEIDAAVFTSARTVDGFVEAIGQQSEYVEELTAEGAESPSVHVEELTAEGAGNPSVHVEELTAELAGAVDLPAVCIGEQTAAAARLHGMKPVIADEATIDSLVDKLIERYGMDCAR